MGPHFHPRTPHPTLAKTSPLVFSVFRTLDIVWAFLKIAYLFDCASYEDVLCMNVDQHDVNWLVVPVSTMNKTSSMTI